MSSGEIKNIALVGNPNSGKSSLFNHLTGLNQKIGNFPGVTVDKKTGFTSLENGDKIEVTDLPGTYSIYPSSKDEQVVFDILANESHPSHPDLVVVIVDASNMKRNLLLFTQIHDLGIPTILALNMMDIVEKSGLKIDHEKLSSQLGVTIVPMNARKGEGIAALKGAIAASDYKPNNPLYFIPDSLTSVIEETKKSFSCSNDYLAYQLLQQFNINPSLTEDEKEQLAAISKSHGVNKDELRRQETLGRYKLINDIITSALVTPMSLISKNFTERLDKIFTHKIWGYAIFFILLFLIFQSIFAWATIPMDLIDGLFSTISSYLGTVLPEGLLSNLLTEGIIPGIGGVVIFIPQIAILFAFISILEETGYMSRVVFLMDKLMRKVGLNGRSVVPLISGVACAIPAIMATRTIENWKERMITIFVTPFMSCSARLPVYTILIALVIPEQTVLGVFNLQGIALMGLYLLGFLMAILSAAAMKFIFDTKERSFLIMEMPTYKSPRWANVGLTMYEKSKTFVLEAGKVILAISIILWVLASFGPGDDLAKAEQQIAELHQADSLSQQEFDNKVQAYKLEKSYAGIFGKAIEPMIAPLGYDWKIGIALITSFAAREVFVSTMATIYSIGDTEEESTIKDKLRSEINPETGKPRYDLPTGMSLLVFYVFAMQCMSTLAVVYRETKGWKWPMLQLVYMTTVAYVAAFVTYNLLS